jgi:hypothetical protein
MTKFIGRTGAATLAVVLCLNGAQPLAGQTAPGGGLLGRSP